MDYSHVEGQASLIPESLRGIWGGDYGYAVYHNNVLIGYAAKYPSFEGEPIQLITVDGEMSSITA